MKFVSTCPDWARKHLLRLTDPGLHTPALLAIGTAIASDIRMLNAWKALDKLHAEAPFRADLLCIGIARAMRPPDGLSAKHRLATARRIELLAKDLRANLTERRQFGDWHEQVLNPISVDLRNLVKRLLPGEPPEFTFAFCTDLILDELLEAVEVRALEWGQSPPMLPHAKDDNANRQNFLRQLTRWFRDRAMGEPWSVICAIAVVIRDDCEDLTPTHVRKLKGKSGIKAA